MSLRAFQSVVLLSHSAVILSPQITKKKKTVKHKITIHAVRKSLSLTNITLRLSKQFMFLWR